MKPFVFDHLSPGVIFVAALGAAFALGAWQGRHTPVGTASIGLVAEHGAFVQSGGVAAEPDRSVPDATEALTHAPAPGAPAALAPTF